MCLRDEPAERELVDAVVIESTCTAGVADNQRVTAAREVRSAEVFEVLARLVHRTSQDAATLLGREDLNPAQFQLLRAVRDRPGEVQREVGRRFGVTAGNVSMLVTKLVAAGLLRREAVGASNRLWLTEAGLQLVERLEPAQNAFLVERFQALSDAELDDLHRLATAAERGLPPPP